MTLHFRIFYQLLSLAIVLALNTACNGNVDSGGGKAKPRQRINTVESKIDGKYRAKLKPLNSVVSTFSTGVVDIQVDGDSLKINVDIKDAPANTRISQFIYHSDHCPSDVNDSNADGFIDALEASKVMRKILLPLDGDLNSQMEGVDDFPTSDQLGSYVYVQEASLMKLTTDLKNVDENPDDELMKLPSGEKFHVENKIVVIQGVQEDIYLPGSVHTFPGHSERATLTIACGKIFRVIENPSAE